MEVGLPCRGAKRAWLRRLARGARAQLKRIGGQRLQFRDALAFVRGIRAKNT